MKIYIASLLQETNTLCPKVTGVDDFKRGYMLFGSDIEKSLQDTNTEIGGFLHVLRKLPNIEIVQGLAAWSVASGKISTDAFHYLSNEIIQQIRACRDLDGVLLCLHGALVCESVEDCEGDLLEKIRSVVGIQTPIVSTLDYHAALTAKMVFFADILIGYRTYPHQDFMDTGIKAARCLIDMVNTRPRFQKIFGRLPLILPVENTETEAGPMSLAIQALERIDKDSHVLSSSLFCPQPWLDVQETGVALVMYVDPDHIEPYLEQNRAIMNTLWRSKEQFFVQYPDASQFLEQVSQYEKPVIAVDSGDITSAGGLGDSTFLLRSVLKVGKPIKAVFTIVDRQTVLHAAAIGEGHASEFNIGGNYDYGYNKRISISAEIVKISESLVEVKGVSFSGVKLDMGKRVLLRCNDSINIIVSEYSSLIHDPEVLRSMGIEPEEQDLIVQKSHKLFRPAYKNIARSIVILNTPGFTPQDLKGIDFRNIRRPIYPLDDMDVDSAQQIILTSVT